MTEPAKTPEIKSFGELAYEGYCTLLVAAIGRPFPWDECQVKEYFENAGKAVAESVYADARQRIAELEAELDKHCRSSVVISFSTEGREVTCCLCGRVLQGE